MSEVNTHQNGFPLSLTLGRPSGDLPLLEVFFGLQDEMILNSRRGSGCEDVSNGSMWEIYHVFHHFPNIEHSLEIVIVLL